MLEYTIYIDALAVIAAFLILIHSLILWAVGSILRLETNRTRLVCGAVVGTLADCAVLFIDLAAGGSGILRGIEGLFTVISLAFATRLAYPNASRRQLLKAVGFSYLFTVVSAGSSLTAYYLTGNNAWAARIVAITSLLVLIEVGWGLLQERLVGELSRVTLSIGVDGAEIEVGALVDTGNSLVDPFSKVPVAIVEYGAISALMPDGVKSVFANLETEALSALMLFDTHSSWSSRVRIIPYVSLGREDGMLLGFRSDFVRISQAGRVWALNDVVVGVHPRRLSPTGDYQALVPPALLPALESASPGSPQYQ